MRALYVPKWQEREREDGGDQSDRKEFDPGMGSDEPETPLPLTVTSRVMYMLRDLTVGPAFRFSQWLELVRKRSLQYGSSGFLQSPSRLDLDMPLSAGESDLDSKGSSLSDQATEVCLWERLGKAAVLDVESSSFSWDSLSSLHNTVHRGDPQQSEDDTSKALEVELSSSLCSINPKMKIPSLRKLLL